MTVAELITLLQAQPQDLEVAYECRDLLHRLEPGDIVVRGASEMDPYGWAALDDPGPPARQYLVLPGN